jgi:hypothetical protein
MYSSRLYNLTERNYTTIEREALAMVYALHKFRHCMLGNRFIFYVDHMVLVYLVYKFSRSHLMANALSVLCNQSKLVGVLDQTFDSHLFILQLEWL